MNPGPAPAAGPARDTWGGGRLPAAASMPRVAG